MIIEELHVKNFGKLQDVRVPFEKGLNLIYGPNESGKTTLHTFLRCMLFGIRRSRGRAAARDVYSRYEPWDYSHYYAGSMRFTSGEKEFYLDRTFQKDNVRAELFCVTDGEKLSVKRGDLSMLIGNISEIVYDNTISIGQTKGITDQDLALELKNYVANYQGTGDSDLNLQKTIQILKDQKKVLQGEQKLKSAQDEAEKNEASYQMLYLRQEVQTLAQRIQMKESQLQQLVQQQEEQGDTDLHRRLKKKVRCRRALDVFQLAAAAGAIAAAVFLPGVFGMAAAAAGALAVGVSFFFRTKLKKQAASIQEHHQEEQQMLARQMERIKGSIHDQKDEWNDKKAKLDTLNRELKLSDQEMPGKTPLEEEMEGIDLAMEVIGIIGQRLQSEIGSQICDRTSEVLAELTQGKYHQVSVDKDLQMGISTRQRYIPVEQLSRGTMEQVHFALRMAVGDVLCSQEPLPVVLDDVFAMYDEQRLMETLQWLIEHKQQVLVFTCHKREEQILNAYGMPYHRVDVFDK